MTLLGPSLLLRGKVAACTNRSGVPAAAVPAVNDYHTMMQMHAAAAAGYTLGNQYAGAVMPHADSPGGNGMVSPARALPGSSG